MDKRFQVGIIGAGRIGATHAESIVNKVRNADVAAVSDIDARAAHALAEKYGIPVATADYRELLANPAIDAVLVCSPTPTHADIAMEAARAGKHVFCEKPVDMSIAKILRTREVVRECGVKFQVGFNRRFDHNHRRVRELVEQGAVGDVQMVRITSRDPKMPPASFMATSGGMFLDMTIHDFDMARYLTGSEVTEVYAMGAVLIDPDLAQYDDVDTAIVTLRFANGAIGVIDNSRQAVYGYDQRSEVFGSKGSVSSENDSGANIRIMNDAGIHGDVYLYHFLERYLDAFAAEIAAFIDAVVNDAPVPVTIDDGLAPVIIAKAAARSRRENRPISIAAFMQGDYDA